MTVPFEVLISMNWLMTGSVFASNSASGTRNRAHVLIRITLILSKTGKVTRFLQNKMAESIFSIDPAVGFRSERLLLLFAGFHDPHAVERPVHEEHGDQQEDASKDIGEDATLVAGQRNSQFDSQQSEQRSELDDRVHSHRGGILERIANGIADHGCRVKVGALLFQFGFNDLLGVIPGAAGIGHEDGLVQTEERDGNQVADEEVGLDESKGQSREEHHEEDIEHTLLGA